MGILYKLTEWIIIVLLIPFILFSDISKNTEEKCFYKNLKTQIKNNIYEMPVTKLTCFDWDKVYFAGPYTQINNNEIHISSSEHYSIDCKTKLNLNNDGEWALLFVKNNEIKNIIRGKGFYFFPFKRKYLIYHKQMKCEVYNKNDTLVLNEDNQFYIRRLR